MPLSRKKKEKAERKAREMYVLSCSYTHSLSSPFLDANWDSAAKKYIETGEPSLKGDFPGPRKEVK